LLDHLFLVYFLDQIPSFWVVTLHSLHEVLNGDAKKTSVERFTFKGFCVVFYYFFYFRFIRLTKRASLGMHHLFDFPLILLYLRLIHRILRYDLSMIQTFALLHEFTWCLFDFWWAWRNHLLSVFENERVRFVIYTLEEMTWEVWIFKFTLFQLDLFG
jgi:hypothetical protein